ncbi:hypothetical protein TI04_01160 [Achromatium sp. WMS2]|nr:hypothetical protein TI04_01160 [Achromatium sp. WMS2]
MAPDLIMQTEEPKFCSLGVVYGDVKQRWFVIYSPKANQRAQKSVNKKIFDITSKAQKSFYSICKQSFACEADARQVAKKFAETLQATTINDMQITTIGHFNRKWRATQDRQPDYYTYHITGTIASTIAYRNNMLRRKSCFIIATNQLDYSAITDSEVIEIYTKDQQKVERGFRFLKDPTFMASTLFLKSPKRIMALMMVMTLCLLVYSALELRIRRVLQANKATFIDQKGKPTAKPTARWVFQFFDGIHIIIVGRKREIISNLNKIQLILLELLGKNYQELYAGTG